MLSLPSLNLRRLAGMLASAALLSACGGGSDSGSSAVGSATINWAAPVVAFKDAQSSFELANYVQTGRHSLPVGSGTNLLAEEASAVAYNKDTDTLFVVGDGGTSITQVTKQGVLIDSMTLAQDATKPQGTYFYDPEGLAYIGGGKFVLVEERYRQFNEFTYTPNTTLPSNIATGAGVRTAKLGTTIGNIGIEGLSFDPMTGGFLAVKESAPLGVFQSTVNFALGTASNGSATTDNSVNLFDPALIGMSAINDVFSMSNILTSTAPDYSHLLILSAPDGKIVKMDRAGKLIGSLVVGATAQNEGMVMDTAGNIYVVSEIGGGAGRPELLVFSPTRSSSAVGVGSNVYITFNQAITLGSGNITLSNGAGDVRSIPITDSRQVTITGNTLKIDPTADLLTGGVYSITYPAGLLKDAQGNLSPANSNATLLSFTAVGVVDTAAPTLLTTSPVNNATNITSSRILLNFNEPVRAGTGNIIISNGMGDTRTISITDSTQVIVTGTTANINPSADFLRSSTYTVHLASGVIRDVAGNAFAGITSTTAFRFTTSPPAVAGTPAAPTLLITEANTQGSDFFEIYNFGTATVDLTGYKWTDEAASTTLTTAGIFPSISIAAGSRLIVVSAGSATAFLSAWGISTPTVAIVALQGPGVGSGDAFVLFDANGKVVSAVNFKATSITANDGTVIAPVTAGAGATFTSNTHAGAAFGGTVTSSAVWDGVSTSTPAYRAAAVGTLGGFAQPSVSTTIGSPGQ